MDYKSQSPSQNQLLSQTLIIVAFISNLSSKSSSRPKSAHSAVAVETPAFRICLCLCLCLFAVAVALASLVVIPEELGLSEVEWGSAVAVVLPLLVLLPKIKTLVILSELLTALCEQRVEGPAFLPATARFPPNPSQNSSSEAPRLGL
jgi:hypothetical protein